MNGADLFSRMQEVLNLMESMQQKFLNMQHNIEQSLNTVKQYQEELNNIQFEVRSKIIDFYCQKHVKSSNDSVSSINKPINDKKNIEPMSVKDAIAFLRRSKVHLSDYGYYLCGSFETRYDALKKAMRTYPIEQILQKLRALIIVWSQNAADQIKSAEEYLNHLRTDFHTLQEESLKPKHA